MLDDHSRKVLRILHNFSTLVNRPPTMEELTRKTGRTAGQVRMSLRILAVQGMIRWHPERHHELSIVRSWEKDAAAGGKSLNFTARP